MCWVRSVDNNTMGMSACVRDSSDRVSLFVVTQTSTLSFDPRAPLLVGMECV